MLFILSPAKSLELHQPIDGSIATIPTFEFEKKPIVDKLKKWKPTQIAKTMSISPKLAELNYERFQNLGTIENLKNARQAAFTFDGDVYQGLDAYTIAKKDWQYAQDHLRILSGLYGILRPLDLIEPYRLEMGTDIAIGKSKNLYAFWSDRVTTHLNESHSDVLLNLASNEYSKVIDRKKLKSQWIDFEFLEKDKSELKSISFYSKKARGLMARYLIDHKISRTEDLADFDSERYQYAPKLSSESKWVYTRKYQPIGKG